MYESKTLEINSDPKTSRIPTSFATVSLNNGPHNFTLPEKLDAIFAAGFDAIELGFPDLQAFASRHLGHDVAAANYDELCAAGKVVANEVADRKLKVLMLQPFSNFEGWPEGSEGRADAFKRAKGWIRIMEAVGTDMLQVGATDTPSPPLSSSKSACAADLAQLADMLAEHKFRLTYENWCWATHGSTWRDVWEIAKMADRPNIGLCLDTYQTAGGEWGDPTTKSGMIEEDGLSTALLEERYRKSLQQLAAEIPADRIYVLQISDAYKPVTPLDPNPDDSGTRPRGRWSGALRPMPFDGGYLPIVSMTKAVLETGFRGCYSMEVFDGGPNGEGKTKDAKAYTAKAMESLERLVEEAAKSPL